MSAVHQGVTGALAALCVVGAFAFTAARPPTWGAGGALLALAALCYWLTPARRGAASIRYGITALATLVGALLLPSRALVVLVLALAVVDWFRFRPTWSRALPAAASQLLAGSFAHATFVTFAPAQPATPLTRALLVAAVMGALALIAVLALQDSLDARLAPATSAAARPARGLLGRLELLTGCAGLGVLAAVGWWVNPLLMAVAALPLALLVRALGAALAQPQARVDARTGLPNAAAFLERADEELARGLRFGRSTGILLVDIDRLGDVNATYGRKAGDAVLRGVADLLRAHARNYDIVARLRADRFAVLLPEAGDDEIHLVAERVRAAVADAQFVTTASDAPLRVTASVGTARHPRHGEYAAALLQAAERGLALARGQGGNGVAPVESGRMSPGVVAASLPVAAVGTGPLPPRGRQAAGTGSAPAPGDARASSPRTWLIYAYISVVCLVAVTLFVATFRPLQWSLAPLYAALLFLGVSLQLSKIELYGRGFLSPGVVVLIVCAALLGPTPTMLLGAVMAVVRWPWKLPPLKGLLFDSASNALVFGLLALAAPGLSLVLPGSGYLHLGFYGLLLGALAYALNISLLVGVMALNERANPLAVWRERFDWMAPHTLAFGVLAAFMTLAYARMGATGLLIFSVPAFMMRFAMKQFVDRTKEHVAALREAHSRLAATNQQLTASVEELERSYNATLTAFSGMLDARDSETEGHSQRVVALALALGRTAGLGPQELAALEVGALLHDIGKVGVADAILRKPGPLSEQEWVEMRKHPEIGHRLTEEIPFLQPASPVVRHHHERWDGSGYPDRLRGEDIPFLARIFAVVDAFDAIVSDRPYRRGQSPARAVAEIRRGAGSQFDPLVAEALVTLARLEGWLEADKLPERPFDAEPTGVTVQNLFGGRLEGRTPATPAARGYVGYATQSQDRRISPGS
ncbi:MAG TPA: diguanylate cyclase [Thermomicrobiales bacterium]|nr:diguanylate cyclase [Thermomicrobiales bacterium]